MKLDVFGCEDWLNVYETKATYDIAQSTMSSLTMDEFLDICQISKEEFYSYINSKKMNYGHIEGSPEFKEQVCHLYEHVTPDMVLQTNGCTGANLLAMTALIEPGDHVIAMHPSYQQLYDYPRGLGAQVDFLELKEENDWQIDINELKNLIRPDTRMICLNNANNPTGTVLNRNILNEIVNLARANNTYILCDEVYKPMEDIDVPSIVDIYERGISTNSLSKTYSLPGIRVGWTAACKEITDIFRKYRDYTMICCGVFDDYVASLALKNKDKILKRNQQLINTNFEILKEWIKNEPKVSLVFPKHVSVSFIKIDVDIPIEEFCINLLNDTGVLLIPGNRFDVEGHARLGYCAKTDVLIEGLKRLSKYLQKY
ncbi:MAG: aminotransferase, partial [Erysipelotrichaceae bacterium]|nr:aminotransferase [Erysipelotrichaceae bacterium]